MAETRIIEYEVDSSNLTSTIRHELLFSISKRWFIKPAYSKKSAGKLVYRVLPGNYVKFSLFASRRQNYAHLSVIMVHLDGNGNIDSKELYEVRFPYAMLYDILNDINAPYVVAKFLEMMQRYHSTAHVEVEDNYQLSEDLIQMVESIKKYFERRLVSQ